ncbi:hypothetical protein E1292_16230 [Nonomuraea deserti]|uniref:Uncharacterized protein n=1 Tax=Nonomuraea deserti TaxID=1848322 RepID=A0A4R4VP87_9ACTN|nr:hypothetical protein [Nonomuraea deserti]TDD05817.1 hypothetical protein E1292_16230 [Nonomuraea deserti]
MRTTILITSSGPNPSPANGRPLTTFEMFIQFLQAFLFAILAAMFIASGLRGSH